MKKFTTAIALVLCLVMCAMAFSACGSKKKKNNTATGGDETTPTTTVVTTDKWEDLGKEVSALAASNRSFKIEFDSYKDAERAARNDVYVAGPDADGYETASAIEQMVYERNKAACDLLGVTVEYDYWSNYGWGAQAKQINTVVQGNDPNAPDVFVFMLYDLLRAMRTNGSFKDIWSIPGSYFDFNAQGWMKDWMESLSFTGDRAYILGSDYFIDIFRNMGVLPFNVDLMDANGSKLSKALFGAEGLAAGETMSQRFFDYVESGNWTWDSLGLLCQAIWDDKDNDSMSSIKDTLGIITESYSGMPAAIILYSTGEALTEVKQVADPTDPNKFTQTITYPDTSAVLGGIFDAVAGVYSGNGALVTTSENKGTTEDDPGMAYHYQKFAQDEVLFTDPSLLGKLEDDVFQQMQSLYSVVPLPKVSVGKEYNTLIHNTADVGAINVNTDPGKAKVITAFFEYCTEHSKEIREEFLEIVTKYKTTTYNQGTDRMLNLIYERVVNARDKAIEDAALGSSGFRFHGKLKDWKFVEGADRIEEEYKSQIDSKRTAVEEVIAEWYQLPKVDAE